MLGLMCMSLGLCGVYWREVYIRGADLFVGHLLSTQE